MVVSAETMVTHSMVNIKVTPSKMKLHSASALLGQGQPQHNARTIVTALKIHYIS